MEVEPSVFPCPNCGANTQVFYSSKTGHKVAWSCASCTAHGWFKGTAGHEKAMIIEEG